MRIYDYNFWSLQSLIFAGILLSASSTLRAQEYPEFDLNYWQAEKDKARGKITRGAILGATGIVAIAPTTVLAIKAAKNPQKFLAYSVVSGIATLGFIFHGFFSVSYGGEQRDKAKGYIDQYQSDVNSVSRVEEREYYVANEKKSTGKTVFFGAVLMGQAAILLANGIVLSVKKKRGDTQGDIKIWPSYLLGGLTLAGGATLVVARTIRYQQLKDLETSAGSTSGAVSIRPYLVVDPDISSVEGGLVGQWTF